MITLKTTVADLLKKKIDIDVYDNVCEELGIAFCGPMELTEKGQEKFGKILDCEVEIELDNTFSYAVVKVDRKENMSWEKTLRLVKELFDSMAGYCDDDDYHEWFIIND